MSRPPVTTSQIDQALERVKERALANMAKHGAGAYASRHEAYGVLAEEMLELLVAIQNTHYPHYIEELLDIAAAAVFAVASFEEQA